MERHIIDISAFNIVRFRVKPGHQEKFIAQPPLIESWAQGLPRRVAGQDR